MFCSIISAEISGVEAVPVSVETDVSEGLPVFSIVGFVSSKVRESPERVKTAMHNLGIRLPPKRIIINIAPGNMRKDGPRFDLPIAAGVLEALGHIRTGAFRDTMILGELHLDGTAERVTGVLPGVLAAKKAGCAACIVPAANYFEAAAVEDIRVIGINTLRDLINYGNGEPLSGRDTKKDGRPHSPVQNYSLDFNEIHGQKAVKRAAVIAASGFHNLLLSGPPGSGKSMTAERIPTIMPALSKEESMEVSKIYSIAGLLPEDTPLVTRRPFRAPHHTVTPSALCGGGINPKPGEITLAHRGVLFLDELPEMNSSTLEMLRQPLEERKITVSRTGGTCVFPASFLLVAAMNPCPCGYFPDRNRCSCSVTEIASYRARISQAFLDRIDIRAEIPEPSFADLNTKSSDEISSSRMKDEVEKAMGMERERYKGTGILFNSELRSSDLEKFCPLSPEGMRLLEAAFNSLGLSARGCHRVIRLARTIADIDGLEIINSDHISEALCCKCGDSEKRNIPGNE